MFFRVAAAAALLAVASAECPNACTGRGECEKHEVCKCFKGFMGNDCSERVCPFGKAHVDGYRGDLNSDGDTDDALTVATALYPNGAKENLDGDEADAYHHYRECSNKGVCDRAKGVCECFEAYEGSACQRASCPNSCSNHGVCKTVRELSAADSKNSYELWDADKGLGCECDAGYVGPDCSGRVCPTGLDPLYLDNIEAPRYPTWSFLIEGSGAETDLVGTVRFKFYDSTGEDWLTEAIEPSAVTSTLLAQEIVAAAFANLPNSVVPVAPTCTYTASTMVPPVAPNGVFSPTIDQWYVECAFTGNPGAHRAPEIVTTDEVGAATVVTNDGTADAAITNAVVFDLGVTGEDTDYFTQYCKGVTIKILYTTVVGAVPYKPYGALAVNVNTDSNTAPNTDADNIALLKCLGRSDPASASMLPYDSGNAGTGAGFEEFPGQYPHMVKLVPEVGDGAAVYGILYFNDAAKEFYLVNAVPNTLLPVPATPAADDDAVYQVYATDSTLQRVVEDTGAAFDITADDVAGAVTAPYSATVTVDFDISCEPKKPPTVAAPAPFVGCLSKGDYVVIPSTLQDGGATGATATGASIAALVRNTAGIYKVVKIEAIDIGGFEYNSVLTLDRPVVHASSITEKAPIFKFLPAAMGSSAFKHVDECAARGICDRSTGLCDCFKGYTNDNCDTQSALAM